MNERPEKKEDDEEVRELDNRQAYINDNWVRGCECSREREMLTFFFSFYSFFIHEVPLVATHIFPALSPPIKNYRAPPRSEWRT